MNTLTPKEAKKKYGKEGKKGAVEIGTVKTPRNVLQISPNYTYNGNDEGQDMGYEMPPMPPMPPMEDIMSYARMGVNEGMKALSEIDWQKEMDFKGLSEEDRREIQEEMKKARIEVEKAMNDPEIRKEMDEARSLSLARGMKAGAERGRAESIRKMSDSERLRADKERLQVQKELLQKKKELMKTEMELQKMKMELERDRQKLKKKSN